MQYKDAALGDTVYFWFAANDTTGTAGDGATPLFDVRLAGAAAGAAPVLSGTPTLLTHANYSDGLFEIAVAATSGNGFAADNEYAVFCTLTISTVNPAGFVGSVRVRALASDLNAAITRVLLALPAAAADAAGGLPISDAGGLDMDAILSRIGTPANLGGGTATLAGNLVDIEAQTDDIGVAGAGLTALGDTRIANLDAAVSTRSTYAGADTAGTTTLLSRVGTPTDLGSGANVSANLVDIEGQTDDIGAAGAGLTALATQASVNTIDDFLDTEIAAIKAKTDNLPASPAATGDIPSAATIADTVWDEAIAGHVGAGSTGAKLNSLSAGGDATAANQTTIINALAAMEGATFDTATDSLEAIRNRGDAAWISGTGEVGGSSWTYTLTATGSGAPIPDALVWVTSDSAGATVLQSGRTNDSGQVTFTLLSGTKYVWRAKAGYNFSNPDTETV